MATTDNSLAAGLAAAGVDQVEFRQNGTAALRYQYLEANPSQEDLEQSAYFAVLACRNEDSGEMTWAEQRTRELENGVPPSAVSGYFSFLEQTFCLGVQ